jgi:hypothetical protein
MGHDAIGCQDLAAPLEHRVGVLHNHRPGHRRADHRRPRVLPDGSRHSRYPDPGTAGLPDQSRRVGDRGPSVAMATDVTVMPRRKSVPRSQGDAGVVSPRLVVDGPEYRVRLLDTNPFSIAQLGETVASALSERDHITDPINRLLFGTRSAGCTDIRVSPPSRWRSDDPAKPIDRAEPLHLLVDSTGLKIYGDGEWLDRKHGVRSRRRWRKLHLGTPTRARPSRWNSRRMMSVTFPKYRACLIRSMPMSRRQVKYLNNIVEQDHSDENARCLSVEPAANKQYVCILLTHL